MRAGCWLSLVVAALVGVESSVIAQENDDVALPVLEALDEGRVLFENLEQTAAIERFSEAIDTLRPVAETGRLSDAQRRVLLDGVSFRARAAFNIGRSQTVAADLDFAIRLEPRFACRDRLVSPVLIQQCEELYANLVGALDVQVRTAETEVRIDGLVVDPSDGPFLVLAGPHLVDANRPGYQGVSESVDVTAGGSTPTQHEIELTRVSSVLQVVTRPPGVTIYVDTVPYGPTEDSLQIDGLGDTWPVTIDGHPRQEFSTELVVPNLPPGPVTMVVTKEGYRAIRTELDLDTPDDYPMHFSLELAEGAVVFDGDGVPDGALVEVQRRGEETSRSVAVDTGQLVLPIGVYAVSVSHPAAGFFEGTATVTDREEYHVQIRLRPTLVALGFLGEDAAGGRMLLRALEEVFDDLDGWTFQNRIAAGVSVIERAAAEAGLTADALREEILAVTPRTEPVDWTRAQAVADSVVRGSVYALAVLDRDHEGRFADLWLWRGAPAPAVPARVRVSLGAGEGNTSAAGVDSVVSAVFGEVSVSRAWLGALLIDSESEGRPFVADVTVDGPAHAAGLAVGDVLVAVNDISVSRAGDVRARLERLPPGGRARIIFERAGVAHETVMTLAVGPVIAGLNEPDIAYPVLAMSLRAAREHQSSEEDSQPPWVWELNDIATTLAAGDIDRALERLRPLEHVVPNTLGVGKGALWYWLGLAYRAAGPEFIEPARYSFYQATLDPNARLGHNDGPWVAPRARARLAQLDRDVLGTVR